jgi:hypothetical protein
MRELNVDEREEWHHFRGRDGPCVRSRGLRFNGWVLLSAVPDRRDHRVSHFSGKKKVQSPFPFFLFCSKRLNTTRKRVWVFRFFVFGGFVSWTPTAPHDYMYPGSFFALAFGFGSFFFAKKKKHARRWVRRSPVRR